MRKIVTGLLTLSLTLCAGLSSVAAETTQHKPPLHADSAKDVTVTIIPTSPVYHVTVNWESLDFTYELGDWNSNQHIYQTGQWTDTDANIKVENHSNADVKVDANFINNTKTVKDEDLNVEANITLDGKKNEVILESADKKEYLNKNVADSTTIEVELVDKAPILNPKHKEVLDTVTVKFGKPHKR